MLMPLAILQKKKQLFSIGCAVNIGAIDFNDEENDIPLLGGWGNYRMPVTVSNDSSRIYFEQGINMYYGFHIIEAIASFQKAIKFDTGFAMGYWGKALAYGPISTTLDIARHQMHWLQWRRQSRCTITALAWRKRL